MLNGIILNRKPCEDGVLPFNRSVFFGTALDLATKSMSLCKDVLVDEGETLDEVGALKKILEQNPSVFDTKSIIVNAYPMPELIAEDLKMLSEKHFHQKAMVSTLSNGKRNYNTAIFESKALLKAIMHLESGSVTDIINFLLKAEDIVHDQNTIPGLQEVSDTVSLYYASKAYRQRMNFYHVQNGVNIVDIDNTYIAPDCEIGKGTMLLPNSIILKGSIIGENCKIGPSSYLENAKVGDNTKINNSQMYDSSIGKDGTVGPFAYIRPDCSLGDKVKIGDFVELKKAKLGDGTKVSHLTYIGDAEVGKNVNFGCGTVVVNYDGYNKYLTEIGDDAFIGCNTNLVAPVKVGNGAFTAAGSTITKNVPSGALAVARVKQDVKDGWADNRRKRMSAKKSENK